VHCICVGGTKSNSELFLGAAGSFCRMEFSGFNDCDGWLKGPYPKLARSFALTKARSHGGG
jgi:hypothetical protein